MRKEKQCLICGNKFIPDKKTSKYCSQQCQWEGLKKPKQKSICLQCGKEYILKRGNSGMYCSNRCQWDSMKLSDEILKQRKEQHDKAIAIKILIKELDTIVNSNINSLINNIDRLSECKFCGIHYIKKHGSIYCSKECRRKAHNKTNWIKKDKRIRINGKPDYSISLDKLYKRDKGICQLCGNKTNYVDYIVDSKGNFIVGYSYPSIDHIIPIAKGGVHQWNNVQLACHRCNTLKRDKIVID